MKIIKYLCLGVILFLQAEQLIFADSSSASSTQTTRPDEASAKITAETKKQLKSAPLAQKKAGVKSSGSAEPKKMPELSPTTTKVRMFINDDTKQVEGIEVIACKGKCTGRTSVPYEKGVKEMQDKAMKIAQDAIKNDPSIAKV